MNKKEFQLILEQGEGYNLEFQESVNDSLGKEMCAFATANIQVYIFSDRVEFVNHGGLVAGMSLEDLGKKSMPRNVFLFGLMQRMDLVEKIGSGILRINQAMKKYCLPNPKIEADENWFTVTYKRPNLQKESYEDRQKKVGEKVGEKVGKELTKNQKMILSTIKGNVYITAKQLSKIVGISQRKIELNIAKLKERGMVRRVGSAKSGHWEVLD